MLRLLRNAGGGFEAGSPLGGVIEGRQRDLALRYGETVNPSRWEVTWIAGKADVDTRSYKVRQGQF